MSVFWKYFKDKLRWLLIWNKGPVSAVVKGMAYTLDACREDIFWLRNQFSPATCDDKYVVAFARSRGIKRAAPEIDDDLFRARVIYAYAWQRMGGKNYGLKKILEYFGHTKILIINLRDEDPARWAEFRVEISPAVGAGFVESDYDFIRWLIGDNKPARSIVDKIIMCAWVKSPVPGVITGQILGEDITVWPWQQSEVEVSSPVPQIAVGYQAVETIDVQPLAA